MHPPLKAIACSASSSTWVEAAGFAGCRESMDDGGYDGAAVVPAVFESIAGTGERAGVSLKS
jgi:hypothetical protein